MKAPEGEQGNGGGGAGFLSCRGGFRQAGVYKERGDVMFWAPVDRGIWG